MTVVLGEEKIIYLLATPVISNSEQHGDGAVAVAVYL